MIPDLPVRWRPLAFTLLGLYASWLSVGIFPVGPVEGDEQAVINGATALARGEIDYLDLAYLPAIQPGSYVALATASRWTGLSVETVFATGTVIGAMLLVWFAARLLARMLALPLWIAVAGLLACQEISAAAYYMNTTALGMWLTFLALGLACRPADWRTATGMSVCLAVAGWIRVDCLLPAPAVPVLLWMATRDLRTTLLVTTVVAAASVALVFALYHGCGVTWTDLSGIYTGRGAIEGWWPTLRSMPLILSPLGCGLLVAGLAFMVARCEWTLLALVAAGCAATLPVYGTSLASTKYFYHLVPMFLIAILYAAGVIAAFVRSAASPLRLGAIVATVLLGFCDQFLALQTSSAEFRRYTPEPVLANLAVLSGPTRPWRLGLGPGELIPTADGFRLRTGAFFAPWAWHQEKTAMLDQITRFSALLRAAPAATVYYSGWLPYQIATRVLRTAGYAYQTRLLAANTMPYRGDWTRQGHRVQLAYLPYQTSEYYDPARRPANPTGEQTFFLGDLNPFEPITTLADRRQWRLLWPEHHHRFVTFFQRCDPPDPSSAHRLNPPPAVGFWWRHAKPDWRALPVRRRPALSLLTRNRRR